MKLVTWPRPDLLKAPDNRQTQTTKIPPDGVIHTRLVEPVQVEDIENLPATYITTGLMHLAMMAEKLSKQIDDRSKPVDEYQPTPFGVNPPTLAIGATIELQATFEGILERIDQVLVTGPAGACTLQLGDRVWALSIPTAGVLVIAPIRIYLSHNDRRVLTAGVQGSYTLELMGYGDVRS